MKDMLEKMRKAQNVIKYRTLFLLLIFISCGIRRSDIINKNYDLKKYKSKSGFSKIIINAYDDETKEKIIASATINNLFFQIQCKNNRTIPLEIITNSNSKLHIEIFRIMKHTVRVTNFIIKEKDSIVINAYLKEDKRPIYD